MKSRAILPAELGWGVYFIGGGRGELTHKTKPKYTAVMVSFPLLQQFIFLFQAYTVSCLSIAKRTAVSNVPHQVSPVKLQN